MRTIARFMDARNTAEGKFLSVLLSVLLVFSFLNVTMFTDYAGADTTPEGDGTEIVTPLEDVEEPEAQPEDEADGPESEEPTGEVNETEPTVEPEAPAVAEEPEESYPAQRLTVKADDGATIVVDAPEGALAAGSSVKAKTVASKSVEDAIEEAVAEDGKELQEMAAYDITIHDAEGNEVEPLKTVGVSIKGAGVEGEGLTVFHVADNGDVERVADIAPTAAVEFDAESFSIYVVAGALVPIAVPVIDQKPVTIKVVYENGVVASTGAIALEKKGEAYAGEYDLEIAEGFNVKSVEPEFEIKDGKLLLSYADKNPAEVVVTLAGTPATYTVEHHLAALTDDEGNVVEKEKVIEETMTGVVGVLTDAKAKTYDPTDDSTSAFKGFYCKGVTQAKLDKAEGTVVRIDYGRQTYKLNYDTQGGSYIAPKSGLYGSKVKVLDLVEGEKQLNCPYGDTHTHSYEGSYVDKGWWGETTYYYGGCYPRGGYSDRWGNWGGSTTPTCGKTEHVAHTDACYSKTPDSYSPAPTRQGYTFAGWYADEECATPAETTAVLSGNVTVYAGWTAQPVSYTVAYFKKVWNNETNKADEVFVSSETRTAIAGESVTAPRSDLFLGNERNYYEFEQAESAQVAADGSTVVKTVYKLKKYTLEFQAELKMNGITYKNKNWYTIENVVLGQNIAEKGRLPSMSPIRISTHGITAARRWPPRP